MSLPMVVDDYDRSTTDDYGHIGNIRRGSYPSLESVPTEVRITSLWHELSPAPEAACWNSAA